MRNNMNSIVALALLAIVPWVCKAAAPDLTAPGVIAETDTTRTYNLGPTGMRGWLYNKEGSGTDGTLSALSRQILITAVGTNTPAYGILATNDVILGVTTGAGNVFTNFTSDARKSLGWAITAAEAGDGVMNIRRWRAGVTNDVSIQLRVMGAYSPTAPYDCPKSALILSNACAIIANRSFNAGIPGDPVLGLALLAGGYTNVLPKVQTYARAIAPATLALRVAPGQSAREVDVWANAYKGIFLAEYYLLTGDTNVLHGIDEYAVSLSQAQGRYGTMCHKGSLQNADGSLHGTMPPYGPVNQGALSASLAIALGKKCMVESGRAIDTEIPQALYRAAQFFGFYAGKGSIPYGEHEPWYEHDGSNGKDGQAALLFTLAGGRPSETEYFTRLTTASYDGREYGHTGQGFSYLWSALGVNVGGTNAVASYLAKVRWHLDLSRRCDGSFAYDGAEQYGGSEVSDYWAVGGNNDYYGIDPTASYVLTYGVAKQKLYITGKNANPANGLSIAAVTNAIWAGTFKLACSGYDTNQLMAALGEYDPLVRNWAAGELGSRSNLNVATFIDLASSANPLLRQSACQVLGVLKNTSALSVLGQRLSDPDVWVRAKAANALRNFSSAASPQLATMLTAFVNNATDPNVVAWEDPIQIANAHLSFGLFGDAVYGGGNVASFTAAASKSLLYPAVQTGLRQPDSNPRFGVASFAYTYLTLADVQALTLDLFEVAAVECQADTMWSADPRGKGIATLAKYSAAEAIPLALSMLITPEGFGWGDDGFKVPALNALKTYGDAARWTLPTLRSYLTEWDVESAEYVALNSAIASIEAATSSPSGFTNLFPVAYPQVVAVTNAKPITLTGFSWRTNMLSFLNVSAPRHGSLTGTPPNLTYTPEVGYAGTDCFSFQVRDALTNSDPATVCLVVGGSGAGLKGDYFNNMDFTAPLFSRIDPQVNFDWGTGSPSNSISADTFSVRWRGLLNVPETGSYQFSTLTSDGVRLYVDGALLIDNFMDQATHWKDSPAIALTEGQQVELQMDYYENTGPAVAKLKWTGPSFAGSNGVIIGKEWLVDASEITNRPAIAYSQSLSFLKNTSKAITLEGIGTPVAYTITTLPTHGTLSGTPPAVTYTPETDYSGTDSFTFTVNNGLSNSSPATVSLAIWEGMPVDYSWKNATPGNWSVAANWTNAAGAAVAPEASGQALYRLNFKKAGTYSVTNDLSNGFLLNQLNAAAAVTFGGANRLALSANGSIFPEINQTSASAITFGIPLDLRAMTTLGGTGGGAVTFSGLLSGTGGLTINNTGALQINNLNNTYTGGTIINAGTISCPAGSGAMTPFLGTGPVTLNSHGTLAFNRTYLTNSIFLNGGTVSGGNSFASVLSGPVTLTDMTTFDFGSTGGFNISGNITGSGGLRTVGSSTWHLSGTNSYTGPTIVEDGMLAYDKSSAVGGSALSISSGAMVSLSYTGTRTITSLTLGGVLQPNNTYGSSASPATIKNDTYFSGTGTLTVSMLQTAQTITFGPLEEKTYGDAPFALTAMASSGLVVSYASSDTNVATVASNLVTILNAGVTTITATQAGNENYTTAAPVPQTLTVNPATQSITFDALPDKTYGDAPFALTSTASSGLPVSYASSDTNVATVAGNTVTIVKAGVTTITATQAGDLNHSAANPVPRPLTVVKAMPVITWNPPSVMAFGVALGVNQLNATSGEVAGTFVYAPPAGTVMPIGNNHILRVNFTPTDTANYSTPPEASVIISVTPVILAEDFEDDWIDNALARTTNQWTSSTVADQSSITNPAVGYAPLPLGVTFPLVYNHMLLRRVLKVNTQAAPLATPMLDAGFASAKVYVDMMAKFGVCLDFPAAVSNDVTAKTSVYLRQDGASTNLVVFHGQKTLDGFGAPIFTPVANGFDPNAWCRLTITLDATTNNTGAEAFSVRINGEPLVSPVAYSDTWKTQIFSESYTPDGGSWFLSASRRLGSSGTNLTTFTGLTFDGEGFVDDLVVTYTNPTFVPGTVIMLALSTGSGGEAWMGY